MPGRAVSQARLAPLVLLALLGTPGCALLSQSLPESSPPVSDARPTALVLGYFDAAALATQRWAFGRHHLVRRVARQRTLAALPVKRMNALDRMLEVAGCQAGSISLGLNRCLGEMVVGGIETTIPLFQELMLDPEIVAGNYDIHWLERWIQNHG